MKKKIRIYMPFAANELKRQLAYKGAFYLFMKTPVDDKEFANLAKKYNILLVPGSSFGCTGFVRIASAISCAVISGFSAFNA